MLILNWHGPCEGSVRSTPNCNDLSVSERILMLFFRSSTNPGAKLVGARQSAPSMVMVLLASSTVYVPSSTVSLPSASTCFTTTVPSSLKVIEPWQLAALPPTAHDASAKSASQHQESPTIGSLLVTVRHESSVP